MEENEIVEELKHKMVWKTKYTIVLLMNIAYIILFYFLMQSFSTHA